MPIATRMRIRLRALLLAMLFPMTGMAQAQGAAESAAAYPARPVRVTIAFAPGGGVDILARAVAQKLSETMGKPFVVENRAGAGGTVAYAMVAKAPPDGYSLLAISGSFAMSAALYPNLAYDPIRDFAPITLMGAAPFLIVAHPSLPVRSVKDLIALAKARPGALNFASGGLGSSGHLTGELFKSMARVQMTYIPYKGGELALIDLIAGQVDLVFSNALSSLPHVRSGRVRPLAVTSTRRYGAAPDIPTVAESGVPGFEAVNWYGWLAPAGTPAVILNRLNGEIGNVVRTSDMQQRFARDGAEPVTSTPAQFSERIVSEVARWRKVVKEANLRVE
jgi:tripartite-type tricarboxylate transporter receptor subunit TctC